MAGASALWKLENFIECLDIWVDLEKPPDGLRRLVTAWIMSRSEDPYQGVRREAGHPNLWFGPVPGSARDGMVVACSFWIYELRRTVKCNSFGTLSLPI